MSGVVRISSVSPNVRDLVQSWQQRYGVSGAVHQAGPSTLLVTADTTVEALEDLMRSLGGSDLEVEIIWRDGELLQA